MTAKSAVAHTQTRHNLVAVGLSILAYALFNLNDVGLKILGGRLSTAEILCLTSALSTAVFVVYGYIREKKAAFTTKKRGLMLARALCLLVEMVLIISALPHLTLTMFYTLIFTAPLWIAVISIFMFRDATTPARMVALIVGFATIVYIFRPGGGLFNIWSLAIFAAAITHAGQLMIARRIGVEESRVCITLYGTVLATLAALPMMLWQGYEAPLAAEWGWILLCAIAGGAGGIAISYAYQVVCDSVLISPLHYTQIIWGALLGYFLFNDTPEPRVLVGSAIIIGIGLFLVFTERRRKTAVA